MATDADLENEGKNLMVAGLKALTAFLDGKAFFQIETDSARTVPQGVSAVTPAPGSVRRIRFMRDPG